jgi:predicted nucleotidyltransferase
VIDDSLRAFRSDVEAAFHGRVRDVVLFGSRARGDSDADSDWDVAVFIDDFDRHQEGRRLINVVVPYRLRGTMISVIGIRSDLHGTSRPLIDAIHAEGVRIEAVRRPCAAR